MVDTTQPNWFDDWVSDACAGVGTLLASRQYPWVNFRCTSPLRFDVKCTPDTHHRIAANERIPDAAARGAGDYTSPLQGVEHEA